MLEGPLVPKIIAFSIPLMISNLLQVLYSAADMIVVARSGATGAVGAIGTTTMPINLIISIFIGFSIGVNVLVARYLGRGYKNRVSSAVHTSLLAGFLFGILGGAVGYLFSPSVMAALGDEGAVLEMAVKYCRIRFLGIPFLALTNFQIAVFRSKGNSTTPLAVLAASGLLNVLLNLLLVLVFGMDVDGVAWATVAANVFSAGLLMLLLSKDDGPCRFSFAKVKMNWHVLGRILQIGVPAGCQAALYTISNLLILSSILAVNNRLCPGGSAIIDGHSAATSIGSFVTTCGDALTLSYVSFTSQHCGARKFERLGTFIRTAYACAAVFSIVASALILLVRDPLLSLYITDPMAFTAAHTRMNIMVTTYVFCMAMNCGAQIMRGMGKSTTSALITLICTCLLRVVWIYTVFAHYRSLESIYLSYPVSWFLAAIVQGVGVWLCYKALVKKSEQQAIVEI